MDQKGQVTQMPICTDSEITNELFFTILSLPQNALVIRQVKDAKMMKLSQFWVTNWGTGKWDTLSKCLLFKKSSFLSFFMLSGNYFKNLGG